MIFAKSTLPAGRLVRASRRGRAGPGERAGGRGRDPRRAGHLIEFLLELAGI